METLLVVLFLPRPGGTFVDVAARADVEDDQRPPVGSSKEDAIVPHSKAKEPFECALDGSHIPLAGFREVLNAISNVLRAPLVQSAQFRAGIAAPFDQRGLLQAEQGAEFGRVDGIVIAALRLSQCALFGRRQRLAVRGRITKRCQDLGRVGGSRLCRPQLF